jgi:hypothetical protein
VELSDIICPRDLRDEREDTKIKMRDVNQAKSKTIQNLQNERLYKWPKRLEEHNREAIRAQSSVSPGVLQHKIQIWQERP